MTSASRQETFDPPSSADFAAAWAAVRAIEQGLIQPESRAPQLARVIYGAERARKLLTGIPTCAERDQL